MGFVNKPGADSLICKGIVQIFTGEFARLHYNKCDFTLIHEAYLPFSKVLHILYLYNYFIVELASSTQFLQEYHANRVRLKRHHPMHKGLMV